MKVLFNKLDMDTCLTAFILGVSEKDELVAIPGDASPQDLAEPQVLCIEVGGSGQIDLNNFDHHDPDGPLETACEQAFAVTGGGGSLRRLVEYVSVVDSGGRAGRFVKTDPPYLSSIFSGMLLCTSGPAQQLLKGMEIFATVLEKGIDPFDTVVVLEEWEEYFKAYESNARRSDELGKMVQRFHTRSGLRGGFLETDYIGAVGLVYGLGYDIAVVCHPCYGPSLVRKFTVAARGVQLRHLKDILNAREPGWGGPSTGTILGSPRDGSGLTLQEVVKTVMENI